MHPTNDPSARSWVKSANDPECDFPIQNLPYGIFSRNAGPSDMIRVGVAIGDFVLDVTEAWIHLRPEQMFLAAELFDTPSLNNLMAAGRSTWTDVRDTLFRWLHEDTPDFRDDPELRRRALVPMDDVTLYMPADIRDYTDFYASREHATNLGSMFRDPKNALLPNYLHIPVGYHGRASSIVVSGTDIIRPQGQTKPADADAPVFGPCRLLDFELEMGFFTGPGNDMGEPIHVEDATEHIFGMVLVNDWSARDIQKWEYVPLGPFLGKNFATSISPWVVTLDALEPYRVKTPRTKDDPKVLPYLDGSWEQNYDIQLNVTLQSAQMEEKDIEPLTISTGNFKWMYWNMCQQLAHHTITGCPISPGDLYASGTISGRTPEARGSMIEITWKGDNPLTLPTGETRKFLADGDTLGLHAVATGEGKPRIGFGSCLGTILPAIELDL